MKKFSYSCGCGFPVRENTDNTSKVQIAFNPDIHTLNLECSRTWDLIGEGNTKGCFQLESRLGRTMAKKLKPENIEQLSALISIMRPGCLEAVREGKSVSNHYIDRKNGLESIDYFHPALKPILEPTYGEMIYQEQTMEIAKAIAGFNLQEADVLRKAIGKKKPEEMAKVKTKFINGCEKEGIVTADQAEQIFGWIEKSQRYLFNKSHSISYAINAYLSAYTKAHFPKVFFASYLRFAKDKIDPQAEIKELVQNALEMDILVNIPDFRLMNELFIIHDKQIYFGLTDIKGVGNSVYKKILQLVSEHNINLYDMSWSSIAFKILLNINSTASKALISAGSLDFCKKTRNAMLFEYSILSELTKKECSFIENLDGEIKDRLINLVKNGKVNKNRAKIINDLINTMENPPYSLYDSAEFISDSECSLLGCSITSSRIEIFDTSIANTTCKEFKCGKNEKNMIIAGEIDGINITKTKTGKKAGLEMAFVTINDTSGNLDSVIFFPEQYQEYRNILFEQNVVLFKGNRSKGSGDSFVVEKCYIAKS
jgi:DNA polymerase-3 subunit alpha